MTVRFLRLAEQELDDAVDWYNQQTEGLGTDFLDEMDRAIRRSVAFPYSSLEIEPGLRRCLLARFPYGVIYGLEGNTLICGSGRPSASTTTFLGRSLSSMNKSASNN